MGSRPTRVLEPSSDGIADRLDLLRRRCVSGDEWGANKAHRKCGQHCDDDRAAVLAHDAILPFHEHAAESFTVFGEATFKRGVPSSIRDLPD